MIDPIKQMAKVISSTRIESNALVEELTNPNRCKDRDSQIKRVQREIIQGQIKGVELAMQAFGTYGNISPGFSAMLALKGDLEIVEKNI